MAVTCIQSTTEYVPDTIIGPSTCGDDFFRVKFRQNGHEIEHHAGPCPLPNPQLMTVLSQRIRSLNPLKNLQPRMLQSLPQRASMCNCSR
mmetsp:Transcript_47883/g.78873  ORF Transcript_47883/g.78873 Transcript_47883/m.78873 type:complete len:90 (+) Transcript_47883:555-824(+)